MGEPPAPSPRTLVIEADPDYAAAINACLSTAGCEVETVPAVRKAISRMQQRVYDLVVWGVTPGENRRTGSVEELRAASSSPLILLDDEPAEARALFESGADQVLSKPFVPGALVGAVKSALRMQGPTSAVAVATRMEIGGSIFDAEQRRITTASGQHATLTRREWDLFTFLLGHSNRYFSATDLIRQAWHDSVIAEEQLRTYVSRIRRKTKDLDVPCRIESRQGLGYRLVLDDVAGS